MPRIGPAEQSTPPTTGTPTSVVALRETGSDAAIRAATPAGPPTATRDAAHTPANAAPPPRRPPGGTMRIRPVRALSPIRITVPSPAGDIRQGIRRGTGRGIAPAAFPGAPTAVPRPATVQGAGITDTGIAGVIGANRAPGGGGDALPAIGVHGAASAVPTPALLHHAARTAVVAAPASRPATAATAAVTAAVPAPPPDVDAATLRRALARLPDGDVGRLAEKLFPHFQRQVRRLQERRGGL